MSPKKRRGRLAAYVCTAAPLLRREMKWQFSVLKIHHRQCYSIENALQGLMHVGNFSTVHSAVDTKLFLMKRLCLTHGIRQIQLKMEYGWNFSISGLKMMMKSGLGKIFLKFLHALTMLFLLLNLYLLIKIQ